MINQLNIKCPNCNESNWSGIDNKNEYVLVCKKCLKIIAYNKSSFLNVFCCEKCNNTSGTLYDNDNNITIICSECNHNNIVFKNIM